jgi:type VI secretion system protein ImpA
MGANIIPAEPPDWGSVREQCVGLLGVSKDLHVAVTLARAEAELEGFSGFAQGLELVAGLLEAQWATVHPRLDADDQDDPTARISAMSGLNHRGVLQALKAAPLVVDRAFGPVSLRSIELATAARSAAGKPGAAANAQAASATAGGSAPTAGGVSGLTMAAIEATFQHVEIERLAQTAEQIAACTNQLQTLLKFWAEKLPDAGLDFSELRKLLAQAHHAVKSRLDTRQVVSSRESAPTTGPDAAPERTNLLGEIRSRDDVLRAIDAICAYYARSEPSSPVPLLLQRCKRLVTMEFTDILKELLPESLPNLQKIAGKTE